jgi:hypothetical protein
MQAWVRRMWLSWKCLAVADLAEIELAVIRHRKRHAALVICHTWRAYQAWCASELERVRIRPPNEIAGPRGCTRTRADTIWNACFGPPCAARPSLAIPSLLSQFALRKSK